MTMWSRDSDTMATEARDDADSHAATLTSELSE